VFSISDYSVAVYGVPVGYFGSKREAREIETDEEWAARTGTLLPTPEEDR
jgi:hypothetical protein